jgi:chemotaxis protein methyltransferase CheR
VIAQDEASCAVWGMPRAVLEAGLACAVLPPDKIAAGSRSGAEEAFVQVSDSSSRILAGLLEARTGQQLTMSRRWRIETALVVAAARARHRHARRADHHPRHGQGAERCRSGGRGPAQQRNLFLPRPPPFDQLLGHACAARARRAPREERRLRIWSAGCSTGQEAYSLAMLFAEDPERWSGWTIDILGTDVSDDGASIARARSLQPVRGPARPRHQPDDPLVRGMRRRLARGRGAAPPVRFQVHNLLEPPPHPGQFDIVLCRNVLLYFSADKKRAGVRAAGRRRWRPDGWLMLGAGETVIGQTERLRSPTATARGLYRLRRRQPGREARRARRAAS